MGENGLRNEILLVSRWQEKEDGRVSGVQAAAGPVRGPAKTARFVLLSETAVDAWPSGGSKGELRPPRVEFNIY